MICACVYRIGISMGSVYMTLEGAPLVLFIILMVLSIGTSSALIVWMYLFHNQDLAEKLERKGVIKILYAGFINRQTLQEQSQIKFVYVRGKLTPSCLPEELHRYKSLKNCFFCSSSKICIYGDSYSCYSKIYGVSVAEMLDKLSHQTDRATWIVIDGFADKPKFDFIRSNFFRDQQRGIVLVGIAVLLSLQLLAAFGSFNIYADLLLSATVFLIFGIVLLFDQFYQATTKGDYFTYGMFHVFVSLVASAFVIILHLCNDLPAVLGLFFTVVITVIWIFAIERCYYLADLPRAFRYYDLRAIHSQRLWFFIVLRLSVITYCLALMLGYFGVGVLPATYDVLLRFLVATSFLIIYGFYHITVNNLAGENLLQQWSTKVENLISAQMEQKEPQKSIPLISTPVEAPNTSNANLDQTPGPPALSVSSNESTKPHTTRFVVVDKL